MAITDLTSTAWRILEGWTAPEGYGVFDVTCDVDNWENIKVFKIGYNDQGSAVANQIALHNLDITNVSIVNSYGSLMLKFYNGADTTNPALLSWVEENCEFIGAITKITWDGQIEGRETITISSGGEIEDVGYLIREIELNDVNSLIGSTFEIYADSSKGEVSAIGSPITDITKLSEGLYQFGWFNFWFIDKPDGVTGYKNIFTYAIKGVYSTEIAGVAFTITVPKTGIYSEVQHAQTEPTYIPYVYPNKLTIAAPTTKTKKSTRLYIGTTVHSSNGKRFRKLQTTEYISSTALLGFATLGVALCGTLGSDYIKLGTPQISLEHIELPDAPKLATPEIYIHIDDAPKLAAPEIYIHIDDIPDIPKLSAPEIYLHIDEPQPDEPDIVLPKLQAPLIYLDIGRLNTPQIELYSEITNSDSQILYAENSSNGLTYDIISDNYQIEENSSGGITVSI